MIYLGSLSVCLFSHAMLYDRYGLYLDIGFGFRVGFSCIDIC